MAPRKGKTASSGKRTALWLLPLLMLLLSSAPLRAEDEAVDLSGAEADDIRQNTAETLRHASVHVGYRFITPDGPTAAASPYERLTSGVIGGFSAGTLGSDLKLLIDGSFLHEDDYRAELFFDYAGLVHAHTESRTFWHNLLYEALPQAVNNPPTLEIRPLDQGATYGVRTAINQADTRIRLGNNPFHLNLGYWELKREGFEQLRFSDYYRTDPSAVISRSNRVDRYTREGSIGLDAHLGMFDLSYGFNIRDFSNQAADPRDTFSNSAGGALITPGNQAHDVIPDSRVTSHTIKLFSDLSGGLVGSASYNLTQRENNGGHGDAVPSERPSDVIHSVAGDLTYTPTKLHSFALKYRHREIDRSTPENLFYPYSQIPASPPGVYTTVPGQLLVRPATSAVMDTLTFSATFRPAPKVIYRLEYNAALELRDNVRDAQTPAGSPTALHPDSRQTHSGTAAFYWKPATGVRINASYRYAACDNPAYGSSFSDRHTGKLLVTYTANGKWGATGSYLARYESNESSARTAPPTNLATPETGVTASMPRTSNNNSVNADFWFSPLERLTISTSYSFLQSNVNQTLLLTNLSQNALLAANYRSSAHVYGVDAVYAATEQLDLSLAFQQIRSKARFDVPDNATFSTLNPPNPPAVYSSAGITDLTRLDSTETAASARADWRITALLGCSLDYSFRRYESGQVLFDGSVHSTMVTLKARW